MGWVSWEKVKGVLQQRTASRVKAMKDFIALLQTET